MRVCLCVFEHDACFFFFLLRRFDNVPVLRTQRPRISPLLPKLILILNVCSCSGSGRRGDCLPFPPSGHLQLHLIQMPICSTRMGVAGVGCVVSASLFGRILRPCSTKVHVRVCTHKIPHRRGFTPALLSLVHR